MSCDGHYRHKYRPGDCDICGHPRDEHRDDGYWGEEENERAQSETDSEAVDPASRWQVNEGGAV